jgi:hypothetical protein
MQNFFPLQSLFPTWQGWPENELTGTFFAKVVKPSTRFKVYVAYVDLGGGPTISKAVLSVLIELIVVLVMAAS